MFPNLAVGIGREEVIITEIFKKNIMANSKEGKERKNVKKEAAKSLKEKRASKAAKRDKKKDGGTIHQK
jgi:hypothetical protein